MNLLILGADSLVGQALAEALVRLEQTHVALDTDAFLRLPKSELLRTVTGHAPTQVLYLASFADLDEAERSDVAAKRCDKVNAQGPALVAEICHKLQVPLLFHSSSLVFDGRKTHPYLEADEPSPQSCVGQTMLAGERAIREVLPEHVILRTDRVFSRRNPQYFQDLLRRFRDADGRLTITSQRFSPTPAADVARVLLAIARQVDCAADAWGTYHYCALQPLAQEVFAEQVLQEVARYDAGIAALLPKLEVTRQPAQPPWIANTVLNSQRLFETFGIKQRSRAGELTALLQMLCNYTPPPAPDAEPTEPVAPAPVPPADPERQGAPRRRLRKKPGSAKPASKDAKRTT